MKSRPLLILILLTHGCGRFGFGLSSDDARPARNSTSLDAGADSAPLKDASTHKDAGCVGCVDNSDAQLGQADAMAGADSAMNLMPGPDVRWVSDTNLSFDNTPDHTCAEGGDMVSYSVVSLAAQGATLDHVPDPGCLSVNDELLLLSVQGFGVATANVGHYELLRIGSVQGAEVTFTNPKQLLYGSGVNDSDIGTGGGQQRVVLQRVPNYRNATVEAGATLRTYAWDGKRGGIIAMRVQGELRVDGRIEASGKGYAGGPSTQPTSTTGQQGESISGMGSSDVSANQGGGGGGLGDGSGCRQSGSPGGGAGHALSGASGTVADCASIGGGAPGASTGDVARLLFGSGGGAGGTDNVRTDNPPGGQGGQGGGIVLLLAAQITGSGRIEVSGRAGQGDAPGVECSGGSTASCWDHSGPGGGGAGGTLLIACPSVAASVAFSFQGGAGGNGNDSWAGNGGAGSRGRMITTTQP